MHAFKAAGILLMSAIWTLSFTQELPPGLPTPGSRDMKIEEDTLPPPEPVSYVTPDAFYDKKPVIDDSLNAFTHQYDPLREYRYELAGLGNLGSAHRDQFFSPVHTKGLDIGMHQYDQYKADFGGFKFYDAETPVTAFDYSQGLDQLDGIFKAKFGRNFSDGVKMSIDYLRVNQDGTFQSQAAKHTAFGLGLWYDSKNGRYDGLLHYGSNSIIQQDNGGLSNITDIDSSALAPINIPVTLSSALTVHRERYVSLQNHLHLNPRKDSITGRKLLFDVIHTIDYHAGFVKFSDGSIQSELDYYGELVLDSRGMRHFIEKKGWTNSLDLQVRLDERTAGPKSFLKAGLEHRGITLYEEPLERKVDEVFLNAALRLGLAQGLSVDGKGYLQLTGQTGNFYLGGDINFTLAEVGEVRGHAGIHNRSPWAVENRLFITQIPAWQHDFADIRHTEFSVQTEISRWQLYLLGAFHLVTNYIYFDENRQPDQLTGTQTVKQLSAQKDFRLGHLGLNAMITIQETPSQLAFPDLILRGQLYYTGRWFKERLQVRTGLDFRMTDDYRGVNYFPATGQFHLDDSGEIPQYPAVDFFFDVQVTDAFKAFVKFENVSAAFANGIFYQTLGYAQFESSFRFGFWMKLFN